MAALGMVPALLATRRVSIPAERAPSVLNLQECRHLLPTFVAYALFGAGYVSYMTFVIALLHSQGSDVAQTTGFWLVLGTVSMLATPFWARLLAALGRA